MTAMEKSEAFEVTEETITLASPDVRELSRGKGRGCRGHFY